MTFSDLTRKEETYNLYENTRTLDFKLNWQKLLNEQGLSYQGHIFIKTAVKNNSVISEEPIIDRHKTAISRYNFSKPVQSILEYNLLEETESFFDYYCNLG
ncbi:MAG: hypothetical protein PF693_07595 [Spirochaetia bacterium]|jgi:hypothetical protein|nr:hypothetical protein [Spirochaetia bacterium]